MNKCEFFSHPWAKICPPHVFCGGLTLHSLDISQSVMVWHSPMAKFCCSSKSPRFDLFKQKLPSDFRIWLRVCKALWFPLGWKCCKTPRCGSSPSSSLIPCKSHSSPRVIRKEEYPFPSCPNVQYNNRCDCPRFPRPRAGHPQQVR